MRREEGRGGGRRREEEGGREGGEDLGGDVVDNEGRLEARHEEVARDGHEELLAVLVREEVADLIGARGQGDHS